MKAKKLMAVLLSIMLILPITMIQPGSAKAAKDIMDNYIVQKIMDKRELKPYTLTNPTRYGFGSGYINTIDFDVSSVAPANLAVSLQLYVENNDHPGNINDLMKTIGGNGRFEVSDNQIGGHYLMYNSKDLKRADGTEIQPGWNDVLLPFSAMGNVAAVDLAHIRFFRLEYFNFTVKPDAYVIRMKDVNIVDTSRPAVPVPPVQYDTTPLVANIPFTKTFNITGGGSAGTPTASFAVQFPPIDASHHDIRKVKLVMDTEIENLTHPGNITVMSQAAGQVELTSSGHNDANELAFSVGSLNWQNGQSSASAMLTTGGATGGTIDYSKINYMRFYMTNWPTTFTDNLVIKISNVRLIDTTNDTTLPTFFNDGMLFQQKKPMNIWGYSDEGKNIKVELFKGNETTALETKTAVAAANRRWDVALSPRVGSYDSYKIVVSEGNTVIQTIKDVAIGELWLAGGQSNMALNVGSAMTGASEVANANNHNIRFFLVPAYPAGQTGDQPIDPTPDIAGAYWGAGDRGTEVNKVSAAAYFMAKSLQPKLNVPVGVISDATGGTIIEAWLPRTAIEGDAEVKAALMKRGLYYDADWWPTEANKMSILYNQKIGPLAGTNIAGTIWYQGESNSNRSEIYNIELNLLKKSWSEAFGFANNSMPFIEAQVAPDQYDMGSTNPQHLGWLAESMTKSYLANADKNMTLFPIYDVPLTHVLNGTSPGAIHPRTKEQVGQRFADSAMSLVYGANDLKSAPIYKSMTVSGNTINLTFDNVGEGLKSYNGISLHGFSIAGADHVYVTANAEVTGPNTVKVWSNMVADPKDVIYAFDNFNNNANLVGAAKGSYYIPVSPFRTTAYADSTSAPDPSVTYYTEQGWMYADKDEWVVDQNDTTINSFGFHPSWKSGIVNTTSAVTYGYSSSLKLEGASALQVNYTGAAGKVIGISPILTYDSLKFKAGNYNYLSVNVRNANENATKIALQFVSGGKTYTAAVAETGLNEKSVAKDNKYATVTFNLRKLFDGTQVVTDTKTLLNAITDMQFTFTGVTDGSLYLDKVMVGATAGVKTDAELTAANLAFNAATMRTQLQATFVADTSPYTAASLVAYNAAKSAADALIQANTTDIVKLGQAIDNVNTAKSALVVKPVSKDELLAEMNKKPTDSTSYITASWDAYMTKWNAAKSVYDNNNATIEQIATATTELAAAFGSLETSSTLLEFGEPVVEQGVAYAKYNGNPSSEAQTFVEEYKGDTVGRINAQKYLYGTLNADSPLRSAEDVIFTIQYYDVGSQKPFLELGQKSTGNAYNNRHFIQLYNTGDLVTLKIYVTDAQMRKAQNGGADFRILASGGDFYVKSIRVESGKEPAIDETLPPVFAGETASNTMIGKTVAGYQMWFTANDTNSGWVHWNSGTRPGVGQLKFENWPDVREYPDNALFPSNFDNLETGEQAKLFTSKNKDVVDLHVSWLRDYGIDGLAVQRFYSSTEVTESPIKNNINLVQDAAEKYNKLFYVMYDLSGSGSVREAAVDRIKKDWVYNIERKGIVSSTSYAYTNGKPVVCLWGLAGDNPSRYPSASNALTLIHWFQDRGYYVIGGLPDNTWASVTNDYAAVYQSLDMASPWTVGRFNGSEDAKAWWERTDQRLEREMAYCEQYGIDFQPVIFPGFAWSNLRNGVNSAPNEIGRESGDFMWTQAALLREHGLRTSYIAMFDEFDEGTSIIKGAEDSYEIPKGEQYLYTQASEGTWLSSDFYLRLTGAIADMNKRDITESNPVSYEVPIEDSLGPVYWRNGFEKRVAAGGELTNVDVGIYNPGDENERGNPKILKRQHSDPALDAFAIEKDTSHRGAYSFRFSGKSENGTENTQLYARIAPTKIKVQNNLELSYYIRAENDLGRYAFIDLLFDDGTHLSDKAGFTGKSAKGTVGEWEKISYHLDSSFIGKTIVAVIAAYDHTGDGVYTAYMDDITIQNEAPTTTPVLSQAMLAVNATSLQVGTTALAQVTGTLNNAAPADLTVATVTYGSSNSAIVSVDMQGHITAVAEGTAQITAEVTLDGVTVQTNAVTITVAKPLPTTPVLSQATLAVNATSLQVGAAASAVVTGTLNNAAPADLTVATVTYGSSNSAVVSVDMQGHITGVAEGTAQITAGVTLNGVSVQTNPVTITVVKAVSLGVPGMPVLSSNSGEAMGLSDGNYTVTMNMWWGNNGTLFKLYENGTLISTQSLKDAAPAAQVAKVDVHGKQNGTYTYTSELISPFGTTTSNPLVVTISNASPGKPVLSQDNWDGDGTFHIAMNMWWGTNATEYRLYENGVLLETKSLQAATPGAQSAVSAIAGRGVGTYEYRSELVNASGVTSSDVLTVRVEK
ncbi:sialate O-acetylesterase [Paenibacillus sp. P36]|uniref:sialate O-acetylesterase n=1 Tax=Paenibacillus sp. P36 TaxID=3342538 RepID=UPI0038B24A5B